MEKGLIFTYVLTYGGAAASLFNPFIGLMVYFAFAIITPEAMWYWAVPKGNYSRIVAIALLIGWAMKNFGGWHMGAAKKIIFSLTMFWVWGIVSMQSAEYPDRSMLFLEAFAKILLPILAAITLIDNLQKLKILAWVLVLSNGYVAFEFNMAYLDGFNRVLLDTGYAGLDNNSICIAMVPGAGLAFFLGMTENKWWRQWLCFFLAAMQAHVPMFGESRGGMLGLVVMGVVSFILVPKQPKHYFAFGLAVVVALRMAGPAVVERFATVFVDEKERDASAQSRLDMWKDCMTLMISHPLTGIGPDNWPMVADRFGWKRGKEAHSLWFQQGAEMGFPGLYFLVAYYFLTVKGLWRLINQKHPPPDPWLQGVGRMVIAALAGFCTSATFVSLEGLEFPYYIALMGAGAIKIHMLQQKEQQGKLAPFLHERQASPAYAVN